MPAPTATTIAQNPYNDYRFISYSTSEHPQSSHSLSSPLPAVRYLADFSTDEASYKVLTPKIVFITHFNKKFSIQQPEFNIYISERTPEAVWDEYKICLEFLWETYCDCEENELTAGAKLLRERIMRFIRKA